VHLADLAGLNLGAARCHFNNHPQNPAVLNPALVGFVSGGKGVAAAATAPHLADLIALIFFFGRKKQTIGETISFMLLLLFLFTSQ